MWSSEMRSKRNHWVDTRAHTIKMNTSNADDWLMGTQRYVFDIWQIFFPLFYRLIAFFVLAVRPSLFKHRNRCQQKIKAKKCNIKTSKPYHWLAQLSLNFFFLFLEIVAFNWISILIAMKLISLKRLSERSVNIASKDSFQTK